MPASARCGGSDVADPLAEANEPRTLSSTPPPTTSTGGTRADAPPADTARWLARLGALIVIGAAAGAAFVGLGLRDFSGDELGSQGHNLLALFDRALSVDDPYNFSAHMPLAWAMRMLVHAVLGDDAAFTWRLHAAVGAVLGALAAWWCVARRGRPGAALAAGLIVAVNPVLSYHAHDSTNYALGPLTGAVTLAGLCDLADGRKSAALWLALGLLLGCVNDYFFGFVLVSAAILTPLLIRRSPHSAVSRAAARKAWIFLGVALAVPAVVLVVRALGVSLSDVIQPHADPLATQPGLLHFLFSEPVRLAVAYQEGYDAFQVSDPWVVVPPVLLVAASVLWGLRSRDPLAFGAATLLALTVAVFMLFAAVFTTALDRLFPVYVRAFTALLPALAVVVALALLSRGPRVGAALIAAVVLFHGAATVAQLGSISDTQTWAADRVAAHWRTGDVLSTGLDLRFRLRDDILDFPAAVPCLPDDLEPPQRFWVVVIEGELEPGDVALCEATSTQLVRDLGYRPRLSENRFPPHYEGGTNSFIPPARLILLERSSPAPGATGRPILTARFEPTLLPGTRRGEVAATWQTARDSWNIDVVPFDRVVPLGPVPRDGGDVMVWVTPRVPRWLAGIPVGLLEPLREPVLGQPPVSIVPDPIATQISVPLQPLGSPWIGVLRRLAALVAGIGAWVVVLWGWRSGRG